MLLRIYTIGHPMLRQQAELISEEELHSNEIQMLIANMRDTMREAPGVGLAAPQVGYSVQLAVIEDRIEYQSGVSKKELSAQGREPVDFHVIINPKIELLSPLDHLSQEGCLSIPNLIADVPRAWSVRVTCLDENAQVRIIEASGSYARILQHEIDHLNGRLYVDLMRSSTLSTIDNYRRYALNASTNNGESARDY